VSGIVVVEKAELGRLVREAVELALEESQPPAATIVEVMTRQEAAGFLRISLSKLDRLCLEGALPYRLLGDTRRFLRNELIAALRDETETSSSRGRAAEVDSGAAAQGPGAAGHSPTGHSPRRAKIALVPRLEAEKASVRSPK